MSINPIPSVDKAFLSEGLYFVMAFAFSKCTEKMKILP